MFDNCSDFINSLNDASDCVNESSSTSRSEIVAPPSPYVGQLFSSLEQAEIFYTSYAKTLGFEISRFTGHKRDKTDSLCSVSSVCKISAPPRANKRPRLGEWVGGTLCKARISLFRDTKENNWRISSLVLEHNHSLPSLDESNSEKDRGLSLALQLDYDAQAAVDYLKQVSSSGVSNMFYRVKYDGNNRIACILWVDGRSRLMYQFFGDVVTFDLTYKMNRFLKPFVPFTGVNHHYQCISFGFAMIRDETEDTFVWVLENWLEAMNYKEPVTFLTNNDKNGLSNAIVRVLSSTHHILCSWDMRNQLYPPLANIGLVRKIGNMLYEKFSDCVYNSLSIDEFEERWHALMRDNELSDNEWLRNLYDAREKWIPIYTKRFFAAGMTTTGRTDGKHLPCTELMNSSRSVKEFVVKSQEAIENQIKDERRADYITKRKKRIIVFGSPLEVHASKVYTKGIFGCFQKEFAESLKYNVKKISELCVDDTKVYAVYRADEGGNSRRYKQVVNNHRSGLITCNCQMFSHTGQICAHILRYFMFKSISEIPTAMILRRWTRDANKINNAEFLVHSASAGSEQNQSVRYNHLMRDYHELATKAACTVRGYKTILKLNARGKVLVDQFDPDENITDLADNEIEDLIRDAPRL